MMPMETIAATKGLLLEIKQVLPALAAQEHRVAEYVLAHPHDALADSITQMADACGVSVTTVSRFCRRLGLAGYRQFKVALAQSWGSAASLIYVDLKPEDTLASMAHKMFSANVQALHETREVLDLGILEQVVDAMLEARRVDIYATGGAGIAARELHFKCMQLGVNANAFLDSQMQCMSAASLAAGDVGIGISHSGQQLQVAEALKLAAEGGATTVALTSYRQAPVAQAARLVLHTASLGAATSYDSPSVRNAQLAVVDVIYGALVLKGQGLALKKMSRVAQAIAESSGGLFHPVSGMPGVS